MSALSPEKLKELKAFIETVRQSPQILDLKELSFFKDYLLELGAKLPSAKKQQQQQESHSHSHSHGHGGSHSHSHAHPESEEEEEENDDDDIPDLMEEEAPVDIEDAKEDPQPEDPELIPEETDAPLETIDRSVEMSDEMFETANNKKMEAMTAHREKNYDDALKLFTEAIKNNPKSGILYASRAAVLLDMKKPLAAIRDCDIAIQISPDSAKGYKIRGKAERAIGRYDAALKDVQTGQKLDWDETTHKLESELKPRAEIINTNKKRKEEVEKKRAEAAAKKAQSSSSSSSRGSGFGGGFGGMGGMPGMGGMGGMPGMGGMGGMPGMPPGMADVMNDPEVMAMMSDPATMAKLQEMMTNPAAAAKYASDPKIANLMAKFSGMSM